MATRAKVKIHHKCAACNKPIDPEFAVEAEGKLIHQSCFRKGI